jgi:hypothetical protein
METGPILDLFYEEPDPDRWVRFDRYPRRLLRRVVRGRARIGGQRRMFLNLCAGLRQIGVPYRVNAYAAAARHPDRPIGIVGKPHVLDRMRWQNPIVFGAAVYSHPIDDADLLTRLPIRKILVPGEWMRRMCEPYWGDTVAAWAVGIDTDRWSDASTDPKRCDVLVYDKILWRRPERVRALLEPIRAALAARQLRTRELRYGFYDERDFHARLAECRAMLFLCEHETQGIAYQQALSRNVPVLAWDPGGDWPDPEYYPDRVRFGPVSSVPYWDDRCGRRFAAGEEFEGVWDDFWSGVGARRFAPRRFVLEHLTLAGAAAAYVRLFDAATGTRFQSVLSPTLGATA